MQKRYYLPFGARGQPIKMQISPILGKKRPRVAFQPQATKCQIAKNACENNRRYFSSATEKKIITFSPKPIL